MVSCDSSAGVVLLGRGVGGNGDECTHRSDALCGRCGIKQRVEDKDGKIAHLSQQREGTTGQRRWGGRVPIPLPGKGFNFITRGKQKHKFATSCSLGCRSFYRRTESGSSCD